MKIPKFSIIKYDHRNKSMKMPPYFIQADAFKAKYLDVMDQVNEKHISIITKHDKAVARLVPIDEAPIDCFGCLKNKITIHDDIIKPIRKKLTPPYNRTSSVLLLFLYGSLG